MFQGIAAVVAVWHLYLDIGVVANYALGDAAPMCWQLDAANTPVACPPGLEVVWETKLPPILAVGVTVPVSIRVKIDNRTLERLQAQDLLSTRQPNMTAAEKWQLCARENTKCAAGATAENCCFFHINVHSCQDKPGVFCGPWISNDGVLVTHTPSYGGFAGPEGVASFDFAVKLFWEGTYTVIGHFKFAAMHFAIGLKAEVKYSTSVCSLPLVPSRAGACEPCLVGSQPLGFGIPPGAKQLTSSQAVALSHNPFCIVCPPGFASKDGTLCEACPAGSISGANESACSACPPGTNAWEPGSKECRLCPPGTYSQEGAGQCISCPRGRYHPGTSSGNASSSLETSLLLTGNETDCTACPETFTTQELRSGSPGDCICPEGTYLRPGRGCVTCATGLVCPIGTGMPEKAQGFYVEVTDNASRALWVFRCAGVDQCPASASLQACPEGLTGRACRFCAEPGHGEGRCGSCPHANILFVLPALLVLYLIYRMDTSLVYGQVTPAYLVIGYVGVVVTVMQLLTIVLDFPGEQLPAQFRWMKTVTELFLFRFDLLFPACTFGDAFSSRLYFDVLPWFSAVLGYGFLYIASLLVSKTASLLWSTTFQPMSLDHVLNCTGMLLMAMFVMSCKSAASYHLSKAHPQAPDTLFAFPDIVAYSTEHLSLLWYHALQVSVCIAGFYAYAAYVCWVAPGRMFVDEAFTTRNSFLIGRWRPSLYCWCLVTMLRNVLVNMVPLMTVMATFRVAFCVWILFFVGLLQGWLQPWRTISNNVLDAVGCGLLVVMTVVSLVLARSAERHEQAAPAAESSAYVILILCLTALFTSVFIAIIHALCTRQAKIQRRSHSARTICIIRQLVDTTEMIESLFIENGKVDESQRIQTFVKGLSDNDAQSLHDAVDVLGDLVNLPQLAGCRSPRRLPTVHLDYGRHDFSALPSSPRKVSQGALPALLLSCGSNVTKFGMPAEKEPTEEEPAEEPPQAEDAADDETRITSV